MSSVTAEIRLRRMLGVFGAGRILNAKTARSQAIGGMTFGVGAALTEEAVIDKRYGYFVNHDLAEYHVMVHADIPAIDAVFVPELDDRSSPMKSKGIGELGICGAGAAVANAVYQRHRRPHSRLSADARQGPERLGRERIAGAAECGGFDGLGVSRKLTGASTGRGLAALFHLRKFRRRRPCA